MSAWRRAGNWTLQFVLRPLLQIALFIFISSLVMSVLALAVGFILRTPWHGISILYTLPGIDLLEQVVKQLPNTILDGITIGFVYAMIALGYTMVYGVLKFVNFAHSEVFMVGGVVGYEIIAVFRDSKLLATFPALLMVLIMLVTAMVVCGLLAVVIERFAYRPLRNAPRLVPLIAAIGISFFLQDFVRAVEALHRNEFNFAYPASDVPYLAQRFTTSITTVWGDHALKISTGINMTAIVVIISAILMLIGLNYFVNGTKLGRAIRAVSQDQSTAALMGINVNYMISITFLVGGALGGAAGVLFGLKTTLITPYVGFTPGIKAFTAAVLGGIGNITGALLGGLMLGLLEAFFSGLLPYFPALGTGYSDLMAFAVLILILIFRPAGLLGKRADEKV